MLWMYCFDVNKSWLIDWLIDCGGVYVCSGCIIQTSYLNAQALYSVHFTSHLWSLPSANSMLLVPRPPTGFWWISMISWPQRHWLSVSWALWCIKKVPRWTWNWYTSLYWIVFVVYFSVLGYCLREQGCLACKNVCSNNPEDCPDRLIMVCGENGPYKILRK